MKQLVANLSESDQVLLPLHPSSDFGLKKHCFTLTNEFSVFDTDHVASETSLNSPDNF